MKQLFINIINKIKTVRPLYIVLVIAMIIVVFVVFFAVYSITKKQKETFAQKQVELSKQVKVSREVIINGAKVDAEIAATPQERVRGLMGRAALADGTGMLFTFGQEAAYTFWMKNMKISLDLVWIGANMTVVDLDKNVPPCTNDNCEYYTPASPVKYVLEVPAGWSDKNGVNIGNTVTINNLLDPSTAPSK
jgi:uncharacterized protein